MKSRVDKTYWKKTTLIVGISVVLMWIGFLVETAWRRSDPRYASYDNYGPGFFLIAPGFYLGIWAVIRIGRGIISYIVTRWRQ